MDIPKNLMWLKFIPLLGMFIAVIDTSSDGVFWEKAYIYYHVVVMAIIITIV